MQYFLNYKKHMPRPRIPESEQRQKLSISIAPETDQLIKHIQEKYDLRPGHAVDLLALSFKQHQSQHHDNENSKDSCPEEGAAQ